MTQPATAAPETPRLASLGMFLAAVMLTVLSAMFHGSHADTRLDGPSGWTAWVVLDIVLVPAPLVAFLVACALLRIRGQAWRTVLADAVRIWLVTAVAGFALAVFWI